MKLKQLDWISVPSPIDAEAAIDDVAFSKGLKNCVSLLKSANGSSEISKALPSGQSTLLFIKTTVAAEAKALS